LRRTRKVCCILSPAHVRASGFFFFSADAASRSERFFLRRRWNRGEAASRAGAGSASVGRPWMLGTVRPVGIGSAVVFTAFRGAPPGDDLAQPAWQGRTRCGSQERAACASGGRGGGRRVPGMTNELGSLPVCSRRVDEDRRPAVRGSAGATCRTSRPDGHPLADVVRRGVRPASEVGASSRSCER